MPDTDDQQREGEQAPGDVVSDDARAVAGEIEGVAPPVGKEVGDFDIDQEEEKQSGHGDERAFDAGGGFFFWGPTRDDVDCGGNEAVGVEIPIEERNAAAFVITEDERIRSEA